MNEVEDPGLVVLPFVFEVVNFEGAIAWDPEGDQSFQLSLMICCVLSYHSFWIGLRSVPTSVLFSDSFTLIILVLLGLNGIHTEYLGLRMLPLNVSACLQVRFSLLFLLTVRSQGPKLPSRILGPEHALDSLPAVRSKASRSKAVGIFDGPYLDILTGMVFGRKRNSLNLLSPFVLVPACHSAIRGIQHGRLQTSPSTETRKHGFNLPRNRRHRDNHDIDDCSAR